MAESKATESYQAFESLRNRFGGPKQSPDRDSHAHQWREKPKRSVFASAAPPLVPLVEEGDQVQETLFNDRQKPNQQKASPVKGKWKHSAIRSNHLNAPNFDALETESVAESVTSCSDSAYSSKSESLSPIAGSFTELSDDGSHDTSPQHEVKKHDTKAVVYLKQSGRLAALKATFEGGGGVGRHAINSPNKTHDSDTDSVSSDVVPQRTKSWNKAIGEWVFEGITALNVSSPQSSPRVRRPSNEVRLPTPLSTPLHGSMENLADSGSRSSLFSSSGVWEEGEDSASWDLPDAKYPPGKFVPAEARRSSIASTSQKASDSPPQSTKEEHTTPAARAVERKPHYSRSTAWVEAKRKYDVLKMRRDYRGGPEEGQEQTERQRKLSAQDGVSSVEQRARLFGGTKPRCGLRRTQSLLVHSRSSPTLARVAIKDTSASFM